MILSMVLLKSKQNVVILGSSGWIGKNFVDNLSNNKNLNLHLYSSNKGKNIELEDGRKYKTIPIKEIINLEVDKVDVFIDLAFPTQDKIKKLGEEQYIETVNSLSFIKEQFLSKWTPKNIFVTSSGAIYWNKDKKNLYSEGKLYQEKFYEEYSANNSSKVLIVRIYGLLAKHFTFDNNYAFTSFIRQAREDKVIKVESTKNVLRSYITFTDLFMLYNEWLKSNNINFQAIDGCSDEIEIKELARLIADFYKVNVQLNKETDGIDKYVGDSKFFQEFLKQKNLESKINSDKILNILEE